MNSVAPVRAMLALASVGAALAATFGGAAAQQDAPSVFAAFGIADPELARSDYVEHCAGCHGVQGLSAPARLPELRGRVGWFMCTPQSRAYLVRLPNIAHSRIAESERLSDMLNFVVFVLGEGSVPRGTKPFTPDEITRERPRVLAGASLRQERARHVETAIRKCGAPASLRLMYVPPTGS